MLITIYVAWRVKETGASNPGIQYVKRQLIWSPKPSDERTTRRKALERWETKVRNCEVTPQAVWPIAKSLTKNDGPKAPTAVHGPLGIKYYLY
jgi:hypothetical protein